MLLLLRSLSLRHRCLLLQGLAHLLKRNNMSLLLLQGHLMLLVQNALLDDGVDLLDSRTWVVREQDLLLSLYPLLLLLP